MQRDIDDSLKTENTEEKRQALRHYQTYGEYAEEKMLDDRNRAIEMIKELRRYASTY